MADKISVENVLRRCGDFGRYQLIHYIFLNLICIGSGINGYYYVFGVAEPSFRCRLPSNIWPDDDQFQSANSTHQYLIDSFISPKSKCENINGSKCIHFVYDRSVFGLTFTESSDFVCSNAVQRTWLATAYQIGPFTSLITGPMSDKFGRKRLIQILTGGLFIIPVFLQLLLQFISMTINAKFALLIIIQLVSSMGGYGIVFLLLMELTSSSHTSFAGNLAMVAYTFGEILITIFAYAARDWLNLKWLSSAYYVLILPYLYFVPESPYWLFSRKKYTQLQVCLKKIAKINGRADTEWFPQYEQLIEKSQVTDKSTKQTTRTSTTRRAKNLRHFSPTFGVGGLIALFSMLLYIKISYGLGAMNTDFSPHWSIVIGAVVEAIGYVSVSFSITTRLGRKYTMMIFALFTSICVLIIPFIKEKNTAATLVISQMGKLTISGTVAVSWIYIPELLPTSLRGLGNGIFVCFGRVGAILAPIIDAALGEKHMKITFYVYSALTLIVVGVVIFLPETRSRSFNEDRQVQNYTQTDNITGDEDQTAIAMTKIYS